MRIILIIKAVFLLGTGQLAANEFTVQGPKIIGPDGREFVAKGVNVNGPHWVWKRSTLDDVGLIADVWKFNTVRINVVLRFRDLFPHNVDLDAIVAAFTAKQVVSMIEVHDYTGIYPDQKDDRPSLAEFTAWWVATAERYKDNPYVWFNLMNEPGGNQPVPELWKSAHETVIRAIRATGAKNIIVLDGHHFGQEGGFKDDSRSGILKYGPYFAGNYENIVFSLHLYSLWALGEDRLNAYIDQVHGRNLPILFGEFGEASRSDESATSAAFKVALPRGIGRIAWHWSSEQKAGNDLTRGTSVGGGWEIDRNDGSKPGNLTWMGSIIWDDNHSVLQPAALELTGPPLVNGGFEEGWRGWENYGKGQLASNEGTAAEGSQALMIPSGATGGGIRQLLVLEPGGSYRFSAQARHVALPRAGSVVGIRLKLTDGSNRNLPLPMSDTAFAHASLEFVVPNGLVAAEIYFHKNDQDSEFVVDAIELTPLSQ